VPVETYFPGAILPEMLKGAEVYQTGRADYSPSGKTGRNSLNNSIILFSSSYVFHDFLESNTSSAETEHKAAALPSHASKILTKLRYTSEQGEIGKILIMRIIFIFG